MASLTSAPGSVNGQFQDQDPVLGVAGTPIDSAFLNMAQGEICNLAIALGGALNPANNAQLAGLLTQGSLQISGWTRLPSGLLMQWATGASGTGGITNVTFPIAFPNQCFTVIACEANAIGWESTSTPSPSVHASYNRSATGFTMVSLTWVQATPGWTGAVGIAFSYIALGY